MEPRLNTCFLGPPESLYIPNGISIGSAVFSQLTADSLSTYNTALLRNNILLKHVHITVPLALLKVTTAGHVLPGRKLSSAHRTLRPALPPSKLLLCMGESGPPSILGSPESSTQTVSRSVQPFLQGSQM